jgi:hypothetical protein
MNVKRAKWIECFFVASWILIMPGCRAKESQMKNDQASHAAFLNRLLKIKVGDTEEHLVGSIGQPLKRSGMQWIYQWSELNGGYYDYFYFTVEDGKVTKIKRSSGHTTVY